MMKDINSEQAEELFAAACEAEEAGYTDKAIKFYERAASLNYTPAMTNLGNIYDDGLPQRKSEEAVRLYKKAVNLGDGVGAYCLAVHYKNLGKMKWAKFWAEKSMRMGYENPFADIVW